MEHTHNVDAPKRLYQIGDSIVSIQQNANFTFRFHPILVAYFREATQQLRLFVNTRHDLLSGIGIVRRDVIKNVPKPAMASSVH